MLDLSVNRRKNIWVSDRPVVSVSKAAAIMGFSRSTFWRRVAAGGYSRIRRVRLRRSWKFDMEDVLRTAYPTADDKDVASLMKEYRERFMEARRRTANGTV